MLDTSAHLTGIAEAGRLAAGAPSDLPAVESFARLLEELRSLDIWAAGKEARAFASTARTRSGNPRVRPDDCARVLAALLLAYKANLPAIRAGDPVVVQRFRSLFSDLAASDMRLYAGSLFDLHMIEAEMLLVMNDGHGLAARVRFYAERPYLVERDVGQIIRVMRMDGIARLLTGEVDGLSSTFAARFATVVQMAPWRATQAFMAFAPFLGVMPQGGAKHSLIERAARLFIAMGRYRTPLKRIVLGKIMAPLLVFCGVIPYSCLRLAVLWALSALRAGSRKEVVVTRAQGGIGDIIMMTPGLRALSQQRGARIKFAVDRKFFPILDGNPHVDVIDIAGPPIDVNAHTWKNLTVCPASFHESRTAPKVRKSRVELFALGMGIGARALRRSGDRPSLSIDAPRSDSRDSFLRQFHLGTRPIIGVQPYSRDSYKDHPEIQAFIERLSETYDVIVFHHAAAGFPERPGIATTAGLPLGESLALVSAVDVMVAVDSAFIHASAAYDIPLVGLFGPTDGRLFTKHHRRKVVLDGEGRFACAPCWRNEDLPCKLTGHVGTSPCIASIDFASVKAAVESMLRR